MLHSCLVAFLPYFTLLFLPEKGLKAFWTLFGVLLVVHRFCFYFLKYVLFGVIIYVCLAFQLPKPKESTWHYLPSTQWDTRLAELLPQTGAALHQFGLTQGTRLGEWISDQSSVTQVTRTIHTQQKVTVCSISHKQPWNLILQLFYITKVGHFTIEMCSFHGSLALLLFHKAPILILNRFLHILQNWLKT